MLSHRFIFIKRENAKKETILKEDIKSSRSLTDGPTGRASIGVIGDQQILVF